MTRAQRIRALSSSPGLWRKVYRIGHRRAYVFAGYDIYTDTFGMRAMCGALDLALPGQIAPTIGARKILADIRRRLKVKR